MFTVGDVNEPPYDLHLTSLNAPIRFPEDEPKVKENIQGILHMLALRNITLFLLETCNWDEIA